MATARRPAVPGWFTMDEQPQLLGSRCTACGAVFFPKQQSFCHNPACAGGDFEEAPLSRRGRLWSYTTNHYPPPPPYVPRGDTHRPFAIAAVELEAEKMVVLGQVPESVKLESLRTGMEMELILDTLFEDEEGEVVVWKWSPVSEAGGQGR